jgi:hypothetical protein
MGSCRLLFINENALKKIKNITVSSYFYFSSRNTTSNQLAWFRPRTPTQRMQPEVTSLSQDPQIAVLFWDWKQEVTHIWA